MPPSCAACKLPGHCTMPLQQWPRLPAPDCVSNHAWDLISVTTTTNDWNLTAMPQQGTSCGVGELLGCADFCLP